jgi:hypothetical protein
MGTAVSDKASGAALNTEMLIDRYLPRFDVTLIEHTVADADVATTWEALGGLDFAQVHTPLTDAAIFVRALPGRVAGWLGRAAPPPAPSRLPLRGNGPGMPGWLSLGEVPEQEIALGAVGRFWQPDIQWYDVTGMTPERFAAFAEPGWGRIASNFSLRPYGVRTLISYEVRTLTADPESAARFARYWRLVRPFVGHIMRAALDAVRVDAERASRR